ncbi:MAG: aspartyl protease family protein [Acidobacteriota bacterium]
MKNRSISYVAVLVSAFVSHASPGFAGQAGCEIPFRLDGHLMVVEASIGKKSGLRFMIDTAATGSVVDKKVIKAIGLMQLPGESQIVTLGQITKANRFLIPMLRIGPVFAELPCREADLAILGVDGIIGIDLLRQQTRLTSCGTNEVIKSGSLTINFETRKLHFGLQQQLEHTVPLESPDPQIVVVAMIQGRPLRLAVDTGTYTIVLYKESQMFWLQPMMTLQKEGFGMLGGMSRGKVVLLPGMELGNSRWTSLSAILLDLPDQTKDGLLSVMQLGLKILHFDFERNLMSWKK